MSIQLLLPLLLLLLLLLLSNTPLLWIRHCRRTAYPGRVAVRELAERPNRALSVVQVNGRRISRWGRLQRHRFATFAHHRQPDSCNTLLHYTRGESVLVNVTRPSLLYIHLGPVKTVRFYFILRRLWQKIVHRPSIMKMWDFRVAKSSLYKTSLTIRSARISLLLLFSFSNIVNEI